MCGATGRELRDRDVWGRFAGEGCAEGARGDGETGWGGGGEGDEDVGVGGLAVEVVFLGGWWGEGG